MQSPVQPITATMDLRIANLRRFLYSHYLLAGVRQGIGMLLPVLVLGWGLGHASLGLIATFGAMCVALIDQPGPYSHRARSMLRSVALGALTVLLTGLASGHPVWLWLAVVVQCFCYSMFTVFGPKGGQVGFACLLLMTITMHAPLTPSETLLHTLTTLAGGLFYIAFSLSLSSLMRLREEQQALSVALYATSHYVKARANFYDPAQDLDDCYLQLIQQQASMTQMHQGARDMVLRALPRPTEHATGRQNARRIMLWNIFVDMLTVIDTLVATQADYTRLRAEPACADLMLFARDALSKMALDLDRVALAVSHNANSRRGASPKAELRAIEYELDQLRLQGYASQQPELYALLVQILRRLRVTARTITRLYEHLEQKPQARPLGILRLDKSLTRFMSREPFQLALLTSNLRLDSPYCRYALRVTLAVAIAMSAAYWLPQYVPQSYWVVLTIVVIMRSGFALTRQLNVLRLSGTLAGCAIALGLLHLTDQSGPLFAALLFTCVMGYSLIQVHYLASIVFNTVFMLLAFHFIAPEPLVLIGDRALDTVIGSVITMACSYVLPWWEARYMQPLGRAAVSAAAEYLRAGRQWVQAMQAQTAANGGQPPGPDTVYDAAVQDADLAWRLARKNLHVAFSNLAQAFYRMMREPRSRQRYVPEVHDLVIQSHILASQIAATIPLIAMLPETPRTVQQALDDVAALLIPTQTGSAPPVATLQFDGAGEEGALAYSLKQMLKAAQLIHHESRALEAQA